MTEKQFFPTSIIDELIYCLEVNSPHNLHLSGTWLLTLEGEVRTDVAQMALNEALNHYPKCKCILHNKYPSYERWFRYRWVYTNVTGKDILQEVELSDPDFNSEKAVDYYVNNYDQFSIDLSSHVPLKVLLIRQSNHAFLIFSFHHAAADGIGGFFFIQKFIQCYEGIFYQQEKSNNHRTSFKDISTPDISFRWNHFSPRRLRPFLKYITQFRKEQSVNLYSHNPPVNPGKYFADVRSLSPRQFEVIRNTAKKNHATINDYLLAIIFQTTKKWSRKWIGQSEHMHIQVPISLRSPEDRTISNNISSINVSLKPELIGEKEELLQLIREQMAVLTKNDIASTLLNLSCFLKLIPIVLRGPLVKQGGPDFCPTLLLSNVGVLSPNPFHKDEDGYDYLGPARICNIHIIPPPGRFPNVTVLTYNNQMVITIAVLDACFSQETAGRLLDAFVHELIGKST